MHFEARRKRERRAERVGDRDRERENWITELVSLIFPDSFGDRRPDV